VLSQMLCDLSAGAFDRLLDDGGFVRALCDDDMKPFEGQFDWFELGRIHRIKSFIDDDKILDHEYDLVQCIVFLRRFELDNIYQERLPASVKAANELRDDLRKLAVNKDPNATITNAAHYIRALNNFETLLRHEAKNLNTFMLESVGFFDINKLIEHGEMHLSASSLSVVDARVKEDFQAAARCLAFDLFTACGFHAVRALEGTARVLYKLVTGKDAADIGRPLGGIANDLRDIADDKHGKPPKPFPKDDPLRLIISNLDAMNNIYRKPLDHPEMVLRTQDDARNVFELAGVSITQIAERITALSKP
jgi:hypothetical protein